MFFAELLGAFDDIVGCAFTPCVNVACRELLSITDSSARIDDIYYIVSWSKQLCTIGIADATFGGSRSTIIIYDKRIFLIGVEIRRQTHHTLNGSSVWGSEVPRFCFAQFNLVQYRFHGVGKQTWSLLFHIVKISDSCIVIALSDIGSDWRVVFWKCKGAGDICFQI